MIEAYPDVFPEHECQTCGARYYGSEAAAGCPCNPAGQRGAVTDGGVAIIPTADGTHNGQPVATDGGAVTEDSNIHHYECQDCGEELDWVEIEECPSCGSSDLEEIHVITDGGSEVTDATSQNVAKNGDEKPDDLEDEISLVITGRKHDVVEIANAIHAGHHYKAHRGELTPPDNAMLEELTEDLDELLDFEGSTEALRARLETGDSDHLLTGNPVDVRLQDEHVERVAFVQVDEDDAITRLRISAGDPGSWMPLASAREVEPGRYELVRTQDGDGDE